MKRRPQSTYANPLFDLAKRAKMENDPSTQMMLFNYGLTGNPHLKRGIEQRLKMLALIEELEPFPFSYLTEEAMIAGIIPKDRIQLGTVLHSPLSYLVNLQDLSKHCAVFGSTGTGKTTLLYWLIVNCMKKEVPVWVFDRDKQDYRHLIRVTKNVGFSTK